MIAFQQSPREGRCHAPLIGVTLLFGNYRSVNIAYYLAEIGSRRPSDRIRKNLNC